MSEFAGSVIGVMQRVLVQEFQSVPQDLRTPVERVDHLFNAVKSRGDDLTCHGRAILGLTVNALDDMYFIGAGAVEFTEETHPDSTLTDRLELVKRSIPRLVFPAILSDAQWQYVRRDLSQSGAHDGRRRLDTKHLMLMQGRNSELPVVSFSSSALIEMDSRIDVRGTSGCPAQGIVIERSFAKFIDSVYGQKPTPDAPRVKPTIQSLDAQASQVHV